VFECEGRPEPFPGVYSASLGEAWRGRLATNPSMQALLRSAPFARVPLADPLVVRSVNTPDDARLLGVDIP
jgi:molybdopterin-guanine dinucleotide biosynthesis protein A